MLISTFKNLFDILKVTDELLVSADLNGAIKKVNEALILMKEQSQYRNINDKKDYQNV